MAGPKDRVLLNLEPSSLTWANADLSGYGVGIAAVRYIPWRSILLTVPAVLWFVAAGVPSALPISVAVAGVLLGVRERRSNRDFLTATSVVRERGLFWRSRHELPLANVDEVRVTRSGLAGYMGSGDLEILSPAGCWTYAGVAEPKFKAEQILRARDAVRRTGS